MRKQDHKLSVRTDALFYAAFSSGYVGPAKRSPRQSEVHSERVRSRCLCLIVPRCEVARAIYIETAALRAPPGPTGLATSCLETFAELGFASQIVVMLRPQRTAAWGERVYARIGPDWERSYPAGCGSAAGSSHSFGELRLRSTGCDSAGRKTARKFGRHLALQVCERLAFR